MSSNSPREYALYIQPEIGDENKNIEENNTTDYAPSTGVFPAIKI